MRFSNARSREKGDISAMDLAPLRLLFPLSHKLRGDCSQLIAHCQTAGESRG